MTRQHELGRGSEFDDRDHLDTLGRQATGSMVTCDIDDLEVHVSAQLVQRLRADTQVELTPAERWMSENDYVPHIDV